MWDLNYKESWAPKNWCFWTVMLDKILESPLDSKEFQPGLIKENQSWMFIGRTDAEAETPIFQPHLMRRTDSFEKTLMLGEIGGRRRRERQRMRRLDGITDLMHMSLGKLGECDGQGGLAHCDSWGCKESDTTEQLNWTEVKLGGKSILKSSLRRKEWKNLRNMSLV